MRHVLSVFESFWYLVKNEMTTKLHMEVIPEKRGEKVGENTLWLLKAWRSGLALL